LSSLSGGPHQAIRVRATTIAGGVDHASIAHCGIEDDSVIKLNGGGLIPPHPPQHNRTAPGTQRSADLRRSHRIVCRIASSIATGSSYRNSWRISTELAIQCCAVLPGLTKWRGVRSSDLVQATKRLKTTRRRNSRSGRKLINWFMGHCRLFRVQIAASTKWLQLIAQPSLADNTLELNRTAVARNRCTDFELRME
jgi:hypothetical protein